jgi:hypothetical protein
MLRVAHRSSGAHEPRGLNAPTAACGVQRLPGAGAKDNGAPGYRDYSPGYFAAFVIDPDGNNIEAVWYDPAKSS